ILADLVRNRANVLLELRREKEREKARKMQMFQQLAGLAGSLVKQGIASNQAKDAAALEQTRYDEKMAIEGGERERGILTDMKNEARTQAQADAKTRAGMMEQYLADAKEGRRLEEAPLGMTPEEHERHNFYADRAIAEKAYEQGKRELDESLARLDITAAQHATALAKLKLEAYGKDTRLPHEVERDEVSLKTANANLEILNRKRNAPEPMTPQEKAEMEQGFKVQLEIIKNFLSGPAEVTREDLTGTLTQLRSIYEATEKGQFGMTGAHVYGTGMRSGVLKDMEQILDQLEQRLGIQGAAGTQAPAQQQPTGPIGNINDVR
ncbi:MAG: hypothetical protein GY820_39290, partial [Gammaproteobacteria bacterium]|nr:hypothetical protein [Gammaproteobacteria bacterium]